MDSEIKNLGVRINSQDRGMEKREENDKLEERAESRQGRTKDGGNRTTRT